MLMSSFNKWRLQVRDKSGDEPSGFYQKVSLRYIKKYTYIYVLFILFGYIERRYSLNWC